VLFRSQTPASTVKDYDRWLASVSGTTAKALLAQSPLPSELAGLPAEAWLLKACVDAGLKRVGVSPEARKYFALHAHLDVEHSKAWNAEALVPLVAEDPRRARYIAEGAVMRLICGEQCFETYRAHLWAHVHPLVYAAE
jgi:hypothetical protein